MPDHFTTLAQPRRPWLEADALKECFHRASAAWHPDVAGKEGGARFAAVNAAYTVLRDPVARLRHLLELEAPEQSASSRPVPPEFADLFMRLASFRQALGEFQKKESAATHGIARALLAGERQALWERAVALRAELEDAYEAALSRLRVLDAEWLPVGAETAARLADLQQHFAYLSKWRAQVGESLFTLQP